MGEPEPGLSWGEMRGFLKKGTRVLGNTTAFVHRGRQNQREMTGSRSNFKAVRVFFNRSQQGTFKVLKDQVQVKSQD